MKKQIFSSLLPAAAAFAWQLYRGLLIPQSGPGEIPSGAMNAPEAVFVSALLTAALVFALCQVLLRAWERLKKKKL